LSAGLDNFTTKDQTLFLVWSLCGEVVNGGFEQFLFNSGGGHAARTVEALRRIGAESVADLLTEAIGVFPGGAVPPDIEERNEVLSALPGDADKVFMELDERFYEIGAHAVMDQLAHYYLQNA
jgi:hypothetical protein